MLLSSNLLVATSIFNKNTQKKGNKTCALSIPLHNKCERNTVFSCTKATVPNKCGKCSQNMHTPATLCSLYFLLIALCIHVHIAIVQRRAHRFISYSPSRICVCLCVCGVWTVNSTVRVHWYCLDLVRFGLVRFRL